jgi:hypothetical protein
MVLTTVEGGFDGVESVVPADGAERREFVAALKGAGLELILEVSTGIAAKPTYDWWIPEPHFTVDDHVGDLRGAVEVAAECGARFVTTMCGYDAWSLGQSIEFFGKALELEKRSGIPISFETHRGRSMFNPWVCRDIIAVYPQMKLTCDFSHWCVVAERLIDTEIEIIRKVAEQAHHVHCRVGYAQHAQVSDPAAPEFAAALAAHERWWEIIWESQRRRGMQTVTMNAEFGPDFYMPLLPYTQAPVADLWSVVTWIGRREREHFEEWVGRAG